MKIAYRPDIDGLRAVAVLGVIAYHAAPAALPGGFFGVDVFFVISGFLITGIIATGMQAGTFSLLSFYGHRVRRIFPALALMLATVWTLGWFLLSPSDFASLGKHIAAGGMFASNFALWSEISYFDVAAEFKPLLHLWSLGIEEQFYLFWPLLMFLPLKRLLVVLIAIASFYIYRKLPPDSAFYLPQARAWELCIGAALALFPRIPGRLHHFLSAIGAALIVAAFAIGAGPKWMPLLPTIGAALLIASPQGFAAQGLAAGPAVAIGKISYPLYLWHWPLLSFAAISQRGELAEAVALALAFPIAWLTYRFVETPIRSLTVPRAAPGLAVVLSVIAVIGASTLAARGLPFRFRGPLALTDERGTDMFRWKEGRCFLDRNVGPEAFPANCIEQGDGPLVLVWGDSHADRLMLGLVEMQKRKQFRLGAITASICPPVPYIEMERVPPCKAINDYALAKIAEVKPDLVIYSARWALFSFDPASHLKYALDVTRQVANKILYIGSFPEWSPSLPKKLISAGIDSDVPSRLKPTYDSIALNAKLAEMAKESRVPFVSPTDYFCIETGCYTTIGSSLTVFDDSHLTDEASIRFAEEMLADHLPSVNRQ